LSFAASRERLRLSLTVLSGSASISDIDIYSSIPIDSTHANLYHQEIAFVPEPAPAALFAIAAIGWLLWQIIHKQLPSKSPEPTAVGALSLSRSRRFS